MQAVVANSWAEGPLPRGLIAQQRWYVVHTQPHRETQAARQLENQNYRVFLPRFLKSRRHARKIETGLVPLFPRYLFIILDLTRDHWRSVNGTYGVDRLLMRADGPEAVPEGLVEQLIELSGANGSVRYTPHFRNGQVIKVAAGPFAEFMGEFQHLDGSGRVRVLLNLLGCKVPVFLPVSHVIPAG